MRAESKEQQGATRKPSPAISTKKQRKTTEWGSLEISSRKSEIPREHFMQRRAQKGQKWWQEHIEEPYKKDLHDSDNHSGVITHLEPDILE